jgi:hypothetical protein
MGWIIFVFALGAATVGLVLWARNREMTVKWFEWLIGTLGVVLILASIQHLFASFREDYSTAGFLGLLAFALPGLILLAVAWQLIARRQRAG